MPTFLVLLVGALIVVAGATTVTRKNPVHAALAMLVALAGVAGLFLGLHAPFLAAMQVLLYGGAIMVLFVFIIMLLTLREEEMGPEPPTRDRVLALIGAFALLFATTFAVAGRGTEPFPVPYPEARAAAGELPGDAEKAGFGSTEHFARFLYTDYAVAFELVTVLVMAAVAGVIVLARRPDKHELDRTRLTGGHS